MISFYKYISYTVPLCSESHRRRRSSQGHLPRFDAIAGLATAGRLQTALGSRPAPRASILQLRADGVGPSEIARRLAVSRTSIHRVLTAAETPPKAV